MSTRYVGSTRARSLPPELGRCQTAMRQLANEVLGAGVQAPCPDRRFTRLVRQPVAPEPLVLFPAWLTSLVAPRCPS